MIKPEELRIGNWVDVTNASKIFTNHGDGKFTEYSRATYVRVSDISSNRILAGGFHCKEDGEPIPLTPEILEKAGFNEMKDNGKGIGVFVNDIYDFEETLLGSGIYTLSIDEDFTKTKIKYLHQLQNLYYALTNTELIINL